MAAAAVLLDSWDLFNASSFAQPDLPRQIRDTSSSPFVQQLDNGSDTGGSLLEGVLNSTKLNNETVTQFSGGGEPYIFDRSDVRAIFLVLYTIVFSSCFFGNLMVILVVTLHWRMRSITNFFLANLAFADLCVGIFCVYQNLVTYLVDGWVFGEFMCKMYHFINCLSTTASVLILVVICIERYLAIIHPLACKQWLTMNRLRVTIVLVWVLSAAISSPRFYYFGLVSMPLSDDQYEIICVPDRKKYDSKMMDMISLTLLFLIPLGIISVLYTQIGIVLWRTSNTKMPAASASVESSSSSGCYYREPADNNIIQTVNLTLIPLSDQVQHQQPRPTTLQPSPPVTHQAAGEKRSFLPARFICLNCKNNSRKHSKNKKPRKHGKSKGVPQSGGGVQANSTGARKCLRNISWEEVGHSNSPAVVGPDVTVTCHHHYPTIMDKFEHGESPGNPCHHVNDSCLTLNHSGDGDDSLNVHEELGGQKKIREGTESPPFLSCCGGGRSSCILRKPGSGDKSVSFSTPPSPYCSRNCLEGKGSKTDPIVVVKFENKQDVRKGRRGHCTILMNNKRSRCASVDEDDNDSCSISTAPSPRFGCNICHPQRTEFEYGNEDSGKCAACKASLHPDSNSLHGENFRRNLSFDHSRAGDGMPLTPVRSLERGPGGEYSIHSVARPCHSCEQPISCHNSPSPPKTSISGTNHAAGTTKRLRRMRIIRSSKYGTGALKSRRRIIKMLIIVVLTFALCHLPFHARKVWQYWSPPWFPYRPGTLFSNVFTPITFLILFVNSAINPILYAFMSKKFRMSFRDLLCCKMRHSLRISRNASVRSTHAVALSQTGC